MTTSEKAKAALKESGITYESIARQLGFAKKTVKSSFCRTKTPSWVKAFLIGFNAPTPSTYGTTELLESFWDVIDSEFIGSRKHYNEEEQRELITKVVAEWIKENSKKR